jgi:hypothetical protein
MPPIRFFLEDAVRMLVIGHLGAAGWDRTKLFEVLGWPYSIFIERGRESQRLAIFPDGMKLDRLAFNTEQDPLPGQWEEPFPETVGEVLARKPWVVRIDLDSYRTQMLKSLVRIVEMRDKRAAALEKRTRVQGRFVKEKETA